MVGVNGTGKTTTVGKLAKQASEGGRSVILGSADTFRAAASEQLDVWAERAQRAGRPPRPRRRPCGGGLRHGRRGRDHRRRPRAHRHGRAAAHVGRSHAGAPEGGSGDREPQQAAGEEGPGDGCHDRAERASAGPGVRRGARTGRADPHQAGRNRQGRHRGRGRRESSASRSCVSAWGRASTTCGPSRRDEFARALVRDA